MAWGTLGEARESLRAGDVARVLRLGYELAAHSTTTELGDAVVGLARLHTSTPGHAWARFSRIRNPLLVAASAPEIFHVAFVTDPARGEQLARALSSLPSDERPAAGTVVKVAQAAFSVGLVDTSSQLVSEAVAGTFGALDSVQAYKCARLANWYPGGERTLPPQLPAADLRFGVLDYKQPDNSSRNVGDFIQSLASLGHLVRRTNLQFVGNAELVSFVNGLRPLMKEERQLSGPASTVHLLELQRDGNVYQSLPEPTWAFMFGWYMHPTFVAGFKFPFNPAIRPLFISFHMNKPEMLTPQGVDYLRRYAPIGCRDWQTVALLTGFGIPAFFSGCITTTVDTLFARQGEDTRTEVGYIDAREGAEGADNIEQSVGDIRVNPLAVNLAMAYEWVSRYHEQYRRVVTSRLHSYLPARSVGCEVEFSPANRSDPRFGGLIDIDDQEFEAIRDGILSKLAVMVGLLASGADEDAVYERWRDLCAADVTFAQNALRERHLTRRPLPPLDTPLPDAPRYVVIDAPKATPSLTRLLGALADRAPDVPVVVVGAPATALPTGVHSVTGISGLQQGSPAAAHQLLVATVLAALPERSQALVLPSDALVRGDLSRLLNLDLGEDAIAARADIRRSRRNHDATLRRISARQEADWQAALDLLAVAHARPGHEGPPFDPRVALVSATRLRAAGWEELAGALIGDYQASWAEALNITLGGQAVKLGTDDVVNVALEDIDEKAPIIIGFAQSRLPIALLGTEAASAL